jgi:hypothetical protein
LTAPCCLSRKSWLETHLYLILLCNLNIVALLTDSVSWLPWCRGRWRLLRHETAQGKVKSFSVVRLDHQVNAFVHPLFQCPQLCQSRSAIFFFGMHRFMSPCDHSSVDEAVLPHSLFECGLNLSVLSMSHSWDLPFNRTKNTRKCVKETHHTHTHTTRIQAYKHLKMTEVDLVEGLYFKKTTGAKYKRVKGLHQ